MAQTGQSNSSTKFCRLHTHSGFIKTFLFTTKDKDTCITKDQKNSTMKYQSCPNSCQTKFPRTVVFYSTSALPNYPEHILKPNDAGH
jgi:hypothetical protein